MRVFIIIVFLKSFMTFCLANHPTILHYQHNVTWTNKSDVLWEWINKLERVKFNKLTMNLQNECPNLRNISSIIEGPLRNCIDMKNHAILIGNFKFDKNKIPSGKGKLVQKDYRDRTKPSSNVCYKLLSSIKKVSGNFVGGKLNGKGKIHYLDQTEMVANFQCGIIHGPVLIWNKHHILQAIGSYQNGMAHGPFWVMQDSIYVQVHFENGYLIAENVIVLDLDRKKATIGTLRDQNHLDQVRNIVVETGQFNEIRVIKVPTFQISQENSMKLPMKIIALPSEQRIMIRPSRILYFNRVAKTGSLNMIILFQSLGVHLGYDVDQGIREKEIVQEDTIGIKKEVDALVQTHESTVKSRHYAFFSLREWGYSWEPDWFSLVRDPIERVSYLQ